MSGPELQGAWDSAWGQFYSLRHMIRMLRRAAACGIPLGKMIFMQIWLCNVRFSGIHPLEAGFLRRQRRRDRRPGLPRESALRFTARYVAELVATHGGLAAILLCLWVAAGVIKLNPRAAAYRDAALEPDDAGDARAARAALSRGEAA